MVKQERLLLSPLYCIDASALINLTKYPGYPRDIFPAIWEKLEDMIKRGELISHIEVYGEIEKRKDEIYHWCNQNKKMFKDIDDCQIKEFAIIKTQYDPDYWNNEINKGGPWADPWLIALSICENAIIITDEKNTPNHIPYIANHFNRQCLNLIDFFKKIGIRY
ncbi:MAG: DUF4411 family protein [Bacteroidales bacterium]